MPSYSTKKYGPLRNCWRLPILILVAGLSLLSCSNLTTVRGENSSDSDLVSSGNQMTQYASSQNVTQYELERLALENFRKHNPNTIVNWYKFNKVIHIPNTQPGLGISGYFLCGQIQYTFSGKTYRPNRIIFNFSNEKIFNIILYDNPETGGHVASSLCAQVEEIERHQ